MRRMKHLSKMNSVLSSIAWVVTAGTIIFSITGCSPEAATISKIEPVSESTALMQPDTEIADLPEPTYSGELYEPTGFVGDAGLGETLSFLDQSGFQGTILVGKDASVVFEKSYGYADVDEGVLNSETTSYEIGLITKQFTAVGVMLLVEEGGVGLDNLLSDYLPEYSHAGEITVRQLLNMTSGVPDYLDKSIIDSGYTQKLLEKGLTRSETMSAAEEFGSLDSSYETVLALVNDRSLSFIPGTDYEYSNTGYVFLAELIARVSGIPYVHFMQKNVLIPAGLETASFEPSSNTASGYLASGKMQMLVPDTRTEAEAGLRMNAKDMFYWSKIVLGRNLLTKESWDLILGFSENDYGFGVSGNLNGDIVVDSRAGGFRCVQVIIPSLDLVIIVLSNRNNDAEIFEQLPGTVIEYYQPTE